LTRPLTQTRDFRLSRTQLRANENGAVAPNHLGSPPCKAVYTGSIPVGASRVGRPTIAGSGTHSPPTRRRGVADQGPRAGRRPPRGRYVHRGLQGPAAYRRRGRHRCNCGSRRPPAEHVSGIRHHLSAHSSRRRGA
jgi:hypothetical protein